MLQKLESIKEKYTKIMLSLSDPALVSNYKQLKKLSKERVELESVIKRYEDYQNVQNEIISCRELLSDSEADKEIITLANAELDKLLNQEKKIKNDLKMLLLPKDPNDAKDVILEIRAGAGGDEASLFAQDLFRMYSRFAEKKDWKLDESQR